MSSIIPSPTSDSSLPSSWKLRQLGQISRVYSGGTPSRGNKTYWNGDIPWATTAEVDFGYIRSTKERITQPGLENSAAKVAPPGTLLIAMYGQGKTRGKTAVLDIHAAMNQACAAVEPSSEISTRFLFHFLEASYDNIRGMSNAGGQENLSGEIVKKIPIVVPTRAEQDGISDILDDSDALIDRLERLIAKKQAIRQGLMQQLLTGMTRLPGFHDEWRNVELGEIAAFSKGAGLPKSAISANGSTPCVHYGELFTHYGPEIDRVTSATVPTGRLVRSVDLDVLMPTSDVTPRGLAKASAIHGSGVILGGDILIIRSDASQAYGPFIAHAIRQDANQVLQLVRGSTVFHLYAADMKNFSLSLPGVGEQRAIAQILRDAGREIENLLQRLAKVRHIKAGMMQELLTGRTRLPPAEIAV